MTCSSPEPGAGERRTGLLWGLAVIVSTSTDGSARRASCGEGERPYERSPSRASMT